jgi:nucleoside-diphosphate-sugar epimerase
MPGRTLPTGGAARWVEGRFDQPAALAELLQGAEVAIHCAGATKALRSRDFHSTNVSATAQLVKAARTAGVRRVILLSSLAASRPLVSDYAASKAAGEAVAMEQAGDMPLTILRAPAVIGPNDQATAPLFSLIARGWIPVPGGKPRMSRFSVIDVKDLAALLVDLALSGPGPSPQPVIAPYGHRALGWADLAASGARVTGKPVRELVLPGLLMSVAAVGTGLAARISGRAQVFSRGKLREMRAGDWIGDTPLVTPTPLDVTMRRCLAPFLSVGNAASNSANHTDRSRE